MNRVVIGGMALLLFGAIAARSKNDPLVFVFLRVDQGVAYLRPMISPDIGVQLDAGPQTLLPSAVLHCQTETRKHPAVVDGQKATISELLLDCGNYKFAVKGLDFSQRAK